MNVFAQPPFMLDYALEYASRGIPVFPCKPRGKRPLTPHGLKDASTDVDVVRGWWASERWPDANIGIPTGIAFDVCDVDSTDALVELDSYGPGELAPVVRTSKGMHVYYEPTGLGNRAGFIPGCDWRGIGGYVIAPPSLHRSGAEYVWENEEAIPPPAPEWLRALIAPNAHAQNRSLVDAGNGAGTGVRGFWDKFVAPKSARYATTALEGELRTVAAASVGTRNHTLDTAALKLGQLVGAGLLARGDVEAGLLVAATTAGLGEREARLTIRSGLDAGVERPRDI